MQKGAVILILIVQANQCFPCDVSVVGVEKGFAQMILIAMKDMDVIMTANAKRCRVHVISTATVGHVQGLSVTSYNVTAKINKMIANQSLELNQASLDMDIIRKEKRNVNQRSVHLPGKGQCLAVIYWLKKNSPMRKQQLNVRRREDILQKPIIIREHMEMNQIVLDKQVWMG